jgi:hypothetical protein
MSNGLECVLMDEDDKLFSIKRDGEEVLSFRSSSLKTKDIVCALQNRVLNILLALHEHYLHKSTKDSGYYEVKDSYREYWKVDIQKTDKIITFEDDYQEFEFAYTITPMYVNDSSPFLEGKFTYHANYFSSCMLNDIIFDIQNQVSEMISTKFPNRSK